MLLISQDKHWQTCLSAKETAWKSKLEAIRNSYARSVQPGICRTIAGSRAYQSSDQRLVDGSEMPEPDKALQPLSARMTISQPQTGERIQKTASFPSLLAIRQSQAIHRFCFAEQKTVTGPRRRLRNPRPRHEGGRRIAQLSLKFAKGSLDAPASLSSRARPMQTLEAEEGLLKQADSARAPFNGSDTAKAGESMRTGVACYYYLDSLVEFNYPHVNDQSSTQENTASPLSQSTPCLSGAGKKGVSVLSRWKADTL